MNAAVAIVKAKRITAGILEVDCKYFGEFFANQLWIKCKARKHSKCVKTQRPVDKGAVVYRPFGNKANRSMRVLAEEIEKCLS